MPRRFQFSLRALLVAIVAGSIALALLRSHDWQYVGAAPVFADKPITVNGRFVQFLGPKKCQLCIDVLTDQENPALMQYAKAVAERSWLCLYPFSVDFAPESQPGKYQLLLYPSDGGSIFNATTGELLIRD